MSKIKVLIADDHAMVSHGLKQILELEDDIVVVAQASNGQEAVELAWKVQPDVILMDINMPIMNGIQAITQLRQENCPARIIVLTIHEDREYLFKTLQSGAQGYVLKDAEPKMLVDAIRNVYIGQSYIQPVMTSQLVKEFNRIYLNSNDKSDDSSLSTREIEVIKLVADGMINKEIAKELYISEKTVKNHVSSIFKKLKVTDRTQAAIYAIKHNLKK